MPESGDGIRELFSATSAEWEIVEFRRELASLLVRVRSCKPPDADVTLWVTSRSELEPAFGRTERFNIALRGEGYSQNDCDLAEAVIEKVAGQEADYPAIDLALPHTLAPGVGEPAAAPDKLHSLVLNVSNRCNLKCRFCFEDRARRTAAMPTIDDIRRTFENDDPSRVRNVMFMSAETVLRKDALELVGMAHEMGYANIGLATNGTYFTSRDRLEPFLLAGLRGMELSIHSMNPDHASYFSRRSFTPQKQRQCLEVIDSLKAEHEFHCTINTVISSLNAGDFLDLVAVIERDFPNIRPTYHVKYTEAIEKIKDEIDVAGWPEIRQAGMVSGLPEKVHPRVSFESFPLCVLSPHYHLSSNLISFLVSDAYRYFLPDQENDLFMVDAFRSRMTSFAVECHQCSLKALCCGMSAAYLELFGDRGHCISQRTDPQRVLATAIEFRKQHGLDYSSEIERDIEGALSLLKRILRVRDATAAD